MQALFTVAGFSGCGDVGVGVEAAAKIDDRERQLARARLPPLSRQGRSLMLARGTSIFVCGRHDV